MMLLDDALYDGQNLWVAVNKVEEIPQNDSVEISIFLLIFFGFLLILWFSFLIW
jgi:hypothetical protein